MLVFLDPQGIGHVEAAGDELLDLELGPLITADAVRYAPKRSGNLAAGIGYYVEPGKLIVFSRADYTLDVEFGHRVYHRYTKRVGPEVVPEQPFMRPALYKYRTPMLPQGTSPLIPPGRTVVGKARSLFQWVARHQRMGGRP